MEIDSRNSVQIPIIFVLLVSFVFLTSCCMPESGDGAINNPPWPVTGPTDVQTLRSNDLSFTLEIRDYGNNLLIPGQFDPDGDAVTMEATLEDIDDWDVIPLVTVSPAGVFTITWDDDLLYLFATFSITVSDGEFTTPSTIDIDVYFDVDI